MRNNPQLYRYPAGSAVSDPTSEDFALARVTPTRH
jgi:hypothetical protein